MPRLVQIFRTKAHRQQILQRHHLNIGLVELLPTFIFNRPLNSLWRRSLVPVATDHENASLKTAVLANDLTTDTAWTTAAFEIACYSYGDDVTSFNFACRVLFVNVEGVGSDEGFGECCSFGTDCASVGSVFVVCTEDDLAPPGEEGCAYAEFAEEAKDER